MAKNNTKANKHKKLASPFSSLASFLLQRGHKQKHTTMSEKEKKEIEEQEEELAGQTEETPAPDTEEDVNTQDSQDEEDLTEEGQQQEDAEKESDEEGAEEEKDPLEAANEKIAELNDKFLRKVAEFDNYRKRTLKEKAELILNGGEKTLKKILPVIDDMERAIENGKKTDDVEALREGMDLIYKKFIKILEGEGVERIETTGKDFDTDYHEAIAMVPGMGDENKGKVIDCVQTGYTLNGKVIRFAKVAVGQ